MTLMSLGVMKRNIGNKQKIPDFFFMLSIQEDKFFFFTWNVSNYFLSLDGFKRKSEKKKKRKQKYVLLLNKIIFVHLMWSIVSYFVF